MATRARSRLGAADTVLAYGTTIARAIRRRLPITTRFLQLGHKLSFGIGRGALDARSVARRPPAAYDVIRYDQQGCYSPQLFFVERGGRVSPRSSPVPGERAGQFRAPLCAPRFAFEDAVGVAAWRKADELRSFRGPDLIADAAGPGALPTPTPRKRWPRALPINPDCRRRQLETGHPGRSPGHSANRGIAAAPGEFFRLAELLGRAGVTRIAAIGTMTAPEAGWHHDGRFNLLDLVRMVEIEQSAELAADGSRYAD